jgi:diguanylate cyclase (GGDEF)-like protein
VFRSDSEAELVPGVVYPVVNGELVPTEFSARDGESFLGAFPLFDGPAAGGAHPYPQYPVANGEPLPNSYPMANGEPVRDTRDAYAYPVANGEPVPSAYPVLNGEPVVGTYREANGEPLLSAYPAFDGQPVAGSFAAADGEPAPSAYSVANLGPIPRPGFGEPVQSAVYPEPEPQPEPQPFAAEPLPTAPTAPEPALPAAGPPTPCPAAHAPTSPDEALRLRALARFIKVIANQGSTTDVSVAAAAEAHRQLGANAVSVSMWERDTGLLRVLVNHGGALGVGVSEQPRDETYPVTDFPTVLLSEDDLGPWIQFAEDGSGDPKRVRLLRSRGQSCALIAPIVFGGRAWGELYAARTAEQPAFDQSDLDYAEALSAQIAAGLTRSGQMERIEQLALTDQLTGLANRRAFDARLDAAMDRHNTDGTVVSLVLCDGNGLKRINDTHGHDHGDALLVELGACVSAAASRLPRSLAARFGGDEFCLLIEGFTADDAVAAAEDMCLRALMVRGGEGMSCGVASTGDPIGRVATRDGLFRLADAAQYRAKRSRSLSPVIAGRGQPPDPALPVQQRGVPIATVRGRAAVPVEALLSQGLAGLDKLPPTAQRADRVEVIVDQVARGLDAASWYIYRRTGLQGPLYQERSAVYRAASESGSYPIPGASQQLRQTELSPTSPPQWIEPIPRVAEQLRGFGAVTPAVGQDANWPPGDLGISPEFLAAAGYTSSVSAGATAADGSQWLVAVLLDEISLWALPALPLLRVLLASAVAI